MATIRKPTLFLIIIAALIIAFLTALLYAQSSKAPSQTKTMNPVNPTGQTNQAEQTTSQPQSIPVKVFFSKHPVSDDDPAAVFPVDRTSPDNGVAKYVIEQLLKGPSAQEQANGYFSTVRFRSDDSTCNGHDFTISVSNGTVTLRFCRTFDALGTVSDGQAQESIKATLLQFSSIKKVIILTKNGDCQFDMSGENRCLM